MKITVITADFTQYPSFDPERLGLERDVDYPQELTLGDLSGNLLMLMWVLITAGLAEMSEAHYTLLVKLQQEINAGHKRSFNPKPIGTRTFVIDYEKVVGLTEEQHAVFKQILAGIVFNQKRSVLLRLLGDEITDRLGDDSEMIDILYEMAIQALTYRIIGSNHLQLFVENFLSKKPQYPDEDDEDEEMFVDAKINGQGVSLMHMMKSIENNVIDENSIRKKISTVYSNRLKLIDYSKGSSETEMSLYAHAPFNLHRIVEAAKDLNVPVPNMFWNTDQVIAFIDAINAKFKETYVDVYFSGKSKEEMPVLDDRAKCFNGAHSPIGALFWMRDHGSLGEDPVPECFKHIAFERLTHGHTEGPLSLNSDCAQPETNYTFSVAVVSQKPENELRDTDSPVALMSDTQGIPFLNAYKGYIHKNFETSNNTPTTGTPTFKPKHDLSTNHVIERTLI